MRASDLRWVSLFLRVSLFFLVAGFLVGAPAVAQERVVTQASIAAANRISVQLGVAEPLPYDASRLARYYLGYSVLAARAYDRYGEVNGTRTLTSSLKLEEEKALPETLRLIRENSVRIGNRAWTLAGGREGCAVDGTCWAPLSRFGVHFWKRHRKAGQCTEVVLAFRGTQFLVPGSLFSNVAPFSVFVRIFTVDHYEQVRLNVDNWVSELRKFGCQNARIVAVGHSLGGGLAKHAAYQNSRINRVYTFNTSPVGAARFIEQKRFERNVKGLEIDNVVEQGDFLGAVRAPFAAWTPPRSCDPQERTITINAMNTNPLGEHRIWAMSKNLHAWENQGRGIRRRDAGLPQLTARQKADLKCITEPREHYMARHDPDWSAERPAAITIRPTPADLRRR